MHNLVALTGVGIVSALGNSARECVEAYQSGVRAEPQKIKEFEGTRFANMVGVTPGEFNTGKILNNRKMQRFMSRAAEIGALAAHEAMKSSQTKSFFRPERIGIYSATGLAGAELSEVVPLLENSIDEKGKFSYKRFGDSGLVSTNPLISFRILPNMPACIISILENIKGPNYIFTPWEDQCGAAILEAFKAVSRGEVDAALAGGADFPSHPASMVFMSESGYIDQNHFPSYGGAYILMEKMELAMERRADIHGIVKAVNLRNSSGSPLDPLSSSFGRMYAAAPAVLLSLAVLGAEVPNSIIGTGGQEFTFKLERLN